MSEWDTLDRKLKKIGDITTTKGIGKGIQVVRDAAVNNLIRNNTGELRGSIFTEVSESAGVTVGICFTNKAYAPYIEFGTGPKGQKNHAGISPNVEVAYTQSPWWIHENQIDGGRETAEKYHWFYIDTEEGRFFQCTGQIASPFMYPALKENKELVTGIVSEEIKEQLRRILT